MVYLDYAATTPVDPRVAIKMQEFLTADGVFGNPSSLHAYGQAAKEAVDLARSQVAALIGAESNEIVWTSGATESNNLSLKGSAQLYKRKGNHIITVKTEHSSVLDCCQQLEKEGFRVTYLTPSSDGLITVEQIRQAVHKETILLSIMQVNNEIGVIQDIISIGKFASENGILFHVDAAQSAGKINIDVNVMHIDLLSLSAHKLYGPKGIGALYIRKKPRVKVAAQLHGGGQENGVRSGTLATHQIVGMGLACEIIQKEMNSDRDKINILKEKLVRELKNLPAVKINYSKNCVPSILNISIANITALDFMKRFPQLAISTGSACHSRVIEPSYVLRALGFSKEIAERSIRISLGRFTTEKDINDFMDCLKIGCSR